MRDVQTYMNHYQGTQVSHWRCIWTG